MTRLDRAFFERDTVQVARELLGCILVHQAGEERTAGQIVETEAYCGWEDTASHAHKGETARNRAMFGPAGITYIYLIYGNYWLLNLIAKLPDADYPAAVLIRALQPVEGLEIMERRRPGRPVQAWTSGPGRLTLAMGIDQRLNHLDITEADSPLFIEAGSPVPEPAVQAGPRIGLGRFVQEPWKNQPWRFWIAGNPFISR